MVKILLSQNSEGGGIPTIKTLSPLNDEELAKHVSSKVDWKTIETQEIKGKLEESADKIFTGNKALRKTTQNVIEDIDNTLNVTGKSWDWQFGQIMENWMVFINFSQKSGLKGPNALIKLNEISFNERSKGYSQHKSESQDATANRDSVDDLVVDALETAYEEHKKKHGGTQFNVLDVGCADGKRTSQIKKKTQERGLDAKFYGSDISGEMVAEARKNEDLESVFQASMLDALPIGNEFSAIICLDDTFGHVPGKEKRSRVLKNFYNSLEPGGFILLDLNNQKGHFTSRTFKNETVRKSFKKHLSSQYKPILDDTEPGEHLYTARGGPGPVCYLHHFEETKLWAILNLGGFYPEDFAAKSDGQTERKFTHTVSLKYGDTPAGKIDEEFNRASLVILGQKSGK